ncbi:MAG: hypothetical protein ACREX9_16600 [Gammaproteobacteria bacterium]
MNTGFESGSVADVDILIDWSLFIVFFLVTFGFGAGVFPAWHPGRGATLIWTTALAAADLFLRAGLAPRAFPRRGVTRAEPPRGYSEVGFLAGRASRGDVGVVHYCAGSTRWTRHTHLL